MSCGTGRKLRVEVVCHVGLSRLSPVVQLMFVASRRFFLGLVMIGFGAPRVLL